MGLRSTVAGVALAACSLSILLAGCGGGSSAPAPQTTVVPRTPGTITEFPVAKAPAGIAAGADGALWFTEVRDRIGRIAPDGRITEFSRGIPYRCSLGGIAAGPDGALWFLEQHKIGRIALDGSLTEYPVAQLQQGVLNGIVTGPDNALWYTDRFANSIGRFTTP